MVVLDDSTLDQCYARKMGLITRHWSGKHRRVVQSQAFAWQGINLITLLWTEGERHIPCDYRLYDRPADGETKNDHFRPMLATAHGRGFQPPCILS